jgi:hypothetical protein
MDDEDGNLIVGSWGSLMEGWGTPEKSGNLVQINIHSKKMKNLGKRKPIGNLDGVESDGSDGYYVTDWSTGRLYQIWKNGKFDVLKTLAKGAADLEVLIEKKLIIVPVMTEGKVVALKID